MVHNPRLDHRSHRAYYALFVLWLVNVLANIDRFSVGIVLQKIKTDLQLTDTQLGLFSGAAFVVSYVALGIPVARWLDRGIRRNILAWAVAVWSLMTLATGAAANFVQLAIARAGLGAGEAACAPGAMSLIGDYFSRGWRTQAVGIFHSALPAAGIVGSPLIGIITDHYGWRAALITFGALGIALALIMFNSKEPSYRKVSRLSLPTQIFGINEPIFFGFPIVLNPIFMVPYILNALILTTCTYLLMHWNVIHKPFVNVPWTTPPIIGHYLVSGGDWKAAVWGFVSILIAMSVYFPFAKAAERQRLKAEAAGTAHE